MAMKIGIVLMARMGSSRLPGKVLKPLAGKPVLERIVWRLERVEAEPLVVATGQGPGNDPIEELCDRLNVACFRGSEENVLERCIQSAESADMDAQVRVGGDNPLVDWRIVNEMLEIFKNSEAKGKPLDYVSNSLERSFPLGLDAEIITTALLRRIMEESEKMDPEQRKSNQSNVIPWLHRNLSKFNTYSYHKDFDYSDLRWTLDTPEDYDLITRIFDSLCDDQPDFVMEDVLALLREHPEWNAINSQVMPQTGYWTDTEKEKFRRRFGREEND